MFKFLLSTLIFILIALIDGSEVFKSKDIKKIVTYSSIFFIGSVLSLLLIMGVKIQNPLEPLETFIVSIFGKN